MYYSCPIKSYFEFIYEVKRRYLCQRGKHSHKIILHYRCDMTKTCCYYLNPPLARTLSNDWHKQPGCHSQPFFKVSLGNIGFDELHLMLRVMDTLEEGLLRDIMKWDEENKSHFNKTAHLHLHCKW